VSERELVTMSGAAVPIASERASLRAVLERVPLLQVVAVIALYVATVVAIPGFGGVPSIKALLVLAAFVGIASVGQTLVALLGGLDLSIPVLIGMSNVAICQLAGGSGWPFYLATVAILLLAALIGGANGFLSKRFGIHPLLVTIGMAAVITGAVRAIAPQGGRATAPAPSFLGDIVSPASSTGPIPIPPLVLLWLLITIGITVMLSRTGYGKRIYATGSNVLAAERARISTLRVWVATFALSSVFAAITGILLAGFTGQGVIFAGDPYLFQTIACVVIGGTSLLGGRGDYVRTVIGALILTELTTLFSGLGFDSPTQEALLGVLILVVVVFYGREEHVRNRI
jgi:ribose transport system permease protein